MESLHLGRDIWLLYELPYGTGRYDDYYREYQSDRCLQEVNRYIEEKRNLIAFSVIDQSGVAATFKQAGFKKVLMFYSSHAGAARHNELIILWHKYNSKAAKHDDAPIELFPDDNCSITSDRRCACASIDEYGYKRRAMRCIIWVPKKGEKVSKGFQRIGKTHLYIKINGKAWRTERKRAPKKTK